MHLAKFLLFRFLRLILVIWGTVTLTFFIFRVIPGDPARIVAGIQATPAEIARIRQSMGLNNPPYIHLDYLNQLLHGNLGFSFHTESPVLSDLLTRLPATIELALASMIITVAVGIPLGVYAATRKGGIMDQIGRSVSIVGIGMPIFWLGLLLLLFLL